MKTPMAFRFAERARSFRNALKGIVVVIRREPNALIHLLASIGVIALGLYEALSPTEWCVIVLAIGIVWVAEAFNTAIEFLGDEISSEKADRHRFCQGRRRRGGASRRDLLGGPGLARLRAPFLEISRRK